MKEGKLFHRKKVSKAILKNVSGMVEPGTLVGIIGPSGAGKTSLLEVLCRRVKKRVTGIILVNGRQISTRYSRI
jgi:ABC-type multidrug transport system ATPase subunit